jgi:SAM-dependent methyltransferase
VFLRFGRKHFDRVFANEDPWHYGVSQYERTKYLRQIEAIQRFCPQPGTILEVGCAEGVFTAMLSEAFPGAKITCVDISPTAIKRAREKLEDLPNVAFIEGDAIELICGGLLHDDRFDVIIQSESLYYMFVQLVFQRKLRAYLHGIAGHVNKSMIFVTSNGINSRTTMMLWVCYRILGRLCRSEFAATYREWNDLKKRCLRYDLRVFRR